jgi:hypothetical protein
VDVSKLESSTLRRIRVLQVRLVPARCYTRSALRFHRNTRHTTPKANLNVCGVRREPDDEIATAIPHSSFGAQIVADARNGITLEHLAEIK